MFYRLNSIYLLGENGTTPTRLLTYYYQAKLKSKNELFNTEHEEISQYIELDFSCVPLIKKNQVNKFIRENKSFFIGATFAAWDKEQKNKVFNDKFTLYVDLYISSVDIEYLTTFEEVRNYHEGETEYIKNYDIKLKKPIATGKTTDLILYKDFDSVPDYYLLHVKSLEEKKKEVLTKKCLKDMSEIISHYEKAIKEGFTLMCFQTSPKQEVFNIIGCCGVVRVEKSPEYKQKEKIKDIINSCLYSNKIISINEIERIMEKLNITVKRGK